MSTDASTYHYDSAQTSHMHAVFVPTVLARLHALKPARALDLGCGNFWSRQTLTRLFEDEQFKFVSFQGLGRLPWLWMTMLLEFKNPAPNS